MTGNNIGSVFLELELNDKQYQKDLKTADKSAGTLNKSFIALGKTIAGAFAVREMWNFFQRSIDLASQLQEVQNVVDTTFGESARVIDEFSRDTAHSFGLSELAAKRYAGTIGALLKSTGISAAETRDMSMALTSLAGDFASFYNVSTQEAFNKIMAGISGETEPLRRWGKNLSVVNLENYALSKGMDIQYEQLTENAKVMLRYNYLLELSQDALGDYNKTSDSYANQVRTQQLRLEQMQTTLGKVLIPTQLSFYKITNTLLGLFNILNPTIQTSIVVFSGLTVTLKILAVVLGVTLKPLTLLLSALAGTALILGVGKLNGGLEKTSSNFTEIYKSTDLLSGSLGKVNTALGKTDKYLGSFDQINNMNNSGVIGNALIGNIDTTGLEDSLDLIDQIQQSGKTTTLFDDWKNGWDIMVDSISTSWDGFWENIGNGYDALLHEIKNKWNNLKLNANNLWEDWKNGANIAVDSFKNKFENVRLNFYNVFSGLWYSFTRSSFYNFWIGIGDWIADRLYWTSRKVDEFRRIIEGNFSSIGGLFGGGGFGGRFAEGGRPPMNQVSLVGEKGPELFVPDTKGTIIPNHQLQGTQMNNDRPINIVLKVNERTLGEITASSINKLTEERGEVVIRV